MPVPASAPLLPATPPSLYVSPVAAGIAAPFRSHWYVYVGLPFQAPGVHVTTTPSCWASPPSSVAFGRSLATGGSVAGVGELTTAEVAALIAPPLSVAVTTHCSAVPSSAATKVYSLLSAPGIAVPLRNQ